MPKKPKPKQRRRREENQRHSASNEQEVREGTRRGLKRHAEAPQQGDEGDPIGMKRVLPSSC